MGIPSACPISMPIVRNANQHRNNHRSNPSAQTHQLMRPHRCHTLLQPLMIECGSRMLRETLNRLASMMDEKLRRGARLSVLKHWPCLPGVPVDVLDVKIWIVAVRQVVKPMNGLTRELIEIVATTRPRHCRHLS